MLTFYCREASKINYNVTNPLRRDVVTVPGDSWAVVRLITDVPGVQ